MIKTLFLSFLVVTFAGVVNLAKGMFPLMQSANAVDVDLADFKCFGMFNNCDNNIDNGVTDNSVDNSDNSQDNDVTISDRFNPTNTCGNNSAEGTFSNNTVTCSSDISSEIAPSTLGLS